MADLEARTHPPAQIVVTGIRCWEDVEYFRDAGYPVKIIALFRSLLEAWKAGLARGRGDHPAEFERFILLYGWEHWMGMGKLFFNADYFLINDGTEDGLYGQLARIVGLDSSKG